MGALGGQGGRWLRWYSSMGSNPDISQKYKMGDISKGFLNTNVNYRYILRLKYLERRHHNMILLVLSGQFYFFGKYLSVHLRLSQLYS